VGLERITPKYIYFLYARTNRCYNERGSSANYARSSIPHCTWNSPSSETSSSSASPRNFIESEVLSPHSQEPATCPCIKPDQPSLRPRQSHSLKIHFNIMSPSTPRSYKWFFPSGLTTKSHLPICATCPSPSNSSLSDHPNNIW
jgi:hypothetical protein